MKGKFFVLLTLTGAAVALTVWANRTRSVVACNAFRVGLAVLCRSASKIRQQILLRGTLWTAGLTALQWVAARYAKNRF